MVDVEYSWIPIKCGKCGYLGHKESRCLQQSGVHNCTTTTVPATIYVSILNTDASHASTTHVAPVTEHISTLITPTTNVEVVFSRISANTALSPTTTLQIETPGGVT